MKFSLRAELPHILPISESDLCVLLSNALENALHACKGADDSIEVQTYEKNGKFFLQVVNRLPGACAVQRRNSGNGPTGPRHRREQHLRHCGAVWRALQFLREGGKVCPAGLPLTAKLHFMPFWGRFVQRRPFFMLPGVS